MNRIVFPAAVLALAAASSLPAASTNPTVDYNVLQGRIASLESKVKTLESALRELTAKVGEPSPTRTSAPVNPIAPPSLPPSNPAAPAPAAVAPAPAPAEVAVKKHVIQEGETVTIIASKYHVPRAELMAANGLREGQQIYIGDEIIIPQPKPAAPAVPAPPKAPAAEPAKALAQDTAPAKPTPASATVSPATATTYKVKAGDTLTKIAREHGTTVSALKSTNQLSSDNLSVGQSLKIPGKGGASSGSVASAPPASPASPPSRSGGGTGARNINHLLRPGETYGAYTVEKGDTLYSLARDFFTTQAELQRLNQMGNSTTLRPGTEIVVPTKKYSEHHNLAKNG